MEVLITEEKKKIFRARKTMKISDRQQLESLHSTLLTAAPGLSNPSPPPVMNGTHKEDGQKAGEKENNVSGSNSPHAQSPSSLTSLSSPAPFLSLNLSPSPPSSHSPKGQDDSSPPASPFHSLNFELNPDGEEKNECLPSSSKDSVSPPRTECKEQQEKDSRVASAGEQKDKTTTTMERAVDLERDAPKGSASCLPAQPPVCDYTEPMDADSDNSKTADLEPSAANLKDGKPSSSKLSASACSSSSGPSHPASSCTDQKQTIEIKEEDAKEQETDKGGAVKKRSASDAKVEVDSLKVEPKKVKEEIGQSARKPSRPSSTPPSDAVKEKSSTSGLKRTLSEGYEKDEPSVKKEGKKMKMERQELEAQLEVKITAKAGSHPKLEKIVQQLVEERVRVLELTIFDKHFQELKDRVDKIDCATKHQAAISTLQAKIARLAKKFGEANQASENKRKQEALAAATAAANAAKTAAVTANSSPVQRVLRRQTVGPRPGPPGEGLVPSVGKTPPLSVSKEKDEEEMEEEDKTDMSRHIGMARKLSDYNEGRCRADIKLRTISSQLENVLYHNCKRSSGDPRPDRYASYVFRYLVPYDVYCDWVAKVNYVGLLGKEALPKNLRRTMRMYIEHRFPLLSCDKWREIRDAINEILRVKRRPEFFREYSDRTASLF